MIIDKMDEIERIKTSYQQRKGDKSVIKASKNYLFNFFMTCERELYYLEILKNHFKDENNILKFLEIGAGSGYNLNFFNRIGISWKNIYANELLEDRFEHLSKEFSNCNLIKGNALNIDSELKFDIILQSTVFTSILDINLKKQLADKLKDLLNENGIILWYDFKFNNPNNKNVKGITKNEIKNLFGEKTKIQFIKVTLAPQISRRIGKLYNFVNFMFPFLRTHLIAVIHPLK